MGIIARVFTSRTSGLLAGHLIPSEEHRASAVTCVIGIAGHYAVRAHASLFHMAANETAEPS
jgi:uncharacterized membrane protein YeaQ/YmgE (transglycosylase-associated protein family)